MKILNAPEPIKEVQTFLNGSHKLLIGGHWVPPVGGDTFEVLNPSNNSVLTKVSKGGEEDMHRAVKAARKAFDSW